MTPLTEFTVGHALVLMLVLLLLLLLFGATALK